MTAPRRVVAGAEGETMIVTILAAQVAPDRVAALVDAFTQARDALPWAIHESFLVRPRGDDMWQIMTIWTSQEALEEYRASVDTPGGVRMFRAVGAEPTLTVYEVVEHAGVE